MKHRKLAQIIGPLISITVLVLAVLLIHNKLRAFSYREISTTLHSIPATSILLAVGLTLLGYIVMSYYDFLALSYIGRKIRYLDIAVSSFISYAFSNNMGFPLITGAIRYRLYSALELSAFEIAKVVAFCTFTLWSGFVLLSGMVFALGAEKLPVGLPLANPPLRLVGIVFITAIVLYLAALHWKRGELRFRQWSITMPEPKTGYAQLLVSSADWIIAGLVLYVLLPAGHNLHFLTFFSFFLLAQFIGVISQVPGGLGVFESVLLVLLQGWFPIPLIIGIMLAFRVIYYLIPLGLAMLIFGGMEMFRQKRLVSHVLKFYDAILGPIAPQFFAIISFLGGLMLLFSGATPALRDRLFLLHRFVPIPVMELSHFIGSIVGIALLLLARGLQKRLNSAYFLTILAMVLGILVSLLKGLDYEEAVALGLMLIALLPCYRHFYRHTHFINQPLSFSWIVSICMALASTLWLGFFSYKHIQYSGDLWWRFSLHSDASRFLRMTVGILGFIFIYAILRLFSRINPHAIPEPDMALITNLVGTSDQTYANLAFLGDKKFFLNDQKTAFLMYATEGRSWVVMGDPIGNKADIPELAWQFYEYCDRYGAYPVFYEVSTEFLNLYLDMGLALIKIGESAKVDLTTYDINSPGHKRRRRTLRTVEATGCTFSLAFPSENPELIPVLKGISDAWQKEKHSKERGFSLGFFSPQYLQRFPVGIVTCEGKCVAFANLWETKDKTELSVDMMRYIPGINLDVMEYLFIKLMLWGKENGYQRFDLGMAPLSGLQYRTLAPLWHKLGSVVFQYGSPIHKLQGLRKYKEKFNPEWHPMYIASPGGFALPEILINLITLISRGYRKTMKQVM